MLLLLIGTLETGKISITQRDSDDNGTNRIAVCQSNVIVGICSRTKLEFRALKFSLEFETEGFLEMEMELWSSALILG
ncbi:hypothetical protein M0802_009349 [Mischocyttarus mexicanus]|nr:hypothetical protein M0802_014677 [Mischocyttarus mexicanus]KAI4493973.1 hypothetical protein M0802_009349 [Mischocyttarus mexicanus]